MAAPTSGTFTVTFEPIDEPQEADECRCGCRVDTTAPMTDQELQESWAVASYRYEQGQRERFRERMERALRRCHINRAESFFVSSPGSDAVATAYFDLTPSDDSTVPEETQLSISFSRKWGTVDEMTRCMETLLSLIANKFVDQYEAGCDAAPNDQTEG